MIENDCNRSEIGNTDCNPLSSPQSLLQCRRAIEILNAIPIAININRNPYCNQGENLQCGVQSQANKH